MTKITTLLEKYSLADYIAWIVGAYLGIFTAYLFTIEASRQVYEHWWYHVGAIAVSIVLMYVPTLFVNLFKKAAKIEE